MLAEVERLVDLVGPRESGLTGAALVLSVISVRCFQSLFHHAWAIPGMSSTNKAMILADFMSHLSAANTRR